MRGKLSRQVDWYRNHRITPADAGKTSVLCCRHTGCRDHPRGCGENSFYNIAVEDAMGSPPRMRGKPPELSQLYAKYRITPADAGKTAFKRCNPARRWDHPRGCGENCNAIFSSMPMSGSPPRMRGKLPIVMLPTAWTRITPADAGKTILALLCNSYSGDHPRGCGENKTDPKEVALKKGSPPRMRGKLKSPSQYCSAVRITPADAGKTG